MPVATGFATRAAAEVRPVATATAARALVALSLLTLTACGGGPPAPAGTAGALLRFATPADSGSFSNATFVAGGASGDLLVRCGAQQARLRFGNEQLALEPLEPYTYLAAWQDAKTGAERFIGLKSKDALGPNKQGLFQPLLVEGGPAYELPGWPVNATAAAVAFAPDGRHLAIGLVGLNMPGQVGLWPLPLAKPRFMGPVGMFAAASLMAWSADSRSLVIIDAANDLSVFRLPKSKAVYRQAFDPDSEGRITAIDISPDGDWIAVAANAVVVRAWKLPFMNTQLKPWGRIKTVFFAGEVGSVVTVDEMNIAIRWAVNYGDVRAAVSRQLPGIHRVRAPTAGLYFAGVDSAGVVHGWRSGDLQPLQSSTGDRPFCR